VRISFNDQNSETQTKQHVDVYKPRLANVPFPFCQYNILVSSNSVAHVSISILYIKLGITAKSSTASIPNYKTFLLF